MATSRSAEPESERAEGKTQRVLACVLCQQRKVKCDRSFPCTHCRRAQTQCIPAGQVPRQRRRRFPERELLDRIRCYEALLQEHSVPFEPLHPPATAAAAGTAAAAASAPSAKPSSPANTGSPDGYQPTHTPGENRAVKQRTANIWHALNQKDVDAEEEHDDSRSEDGEPQNRPISDDGELGDAAIRNAWERRCPPGADQNLLLFGSSLGSRVDLTALHPSQANIFRLWQTYLDNVNPLLKVTHTPSLQPRIIQAAGDLAAASAPLEALLFSIYCVAVLSLAEDQCRAVFASPKKELLAGYQFACRQALVNAGFLQSDDHDCLTALYLYLLSARLEADPRSLSSMLAVAVRIAQRLGYHSEFANARFPAFRAELRRRLWWSLIIFDSRVCELFHHRTTTLVPTWDCRPPSNLNDFELLPGAKALPQGGDRPSEAVFVVVRSKLADFVRHCDFYLNFVDPFLTTFAQAKDAARHRAGLSQTRDLLELEKEIEEQILALCDPENPVHFMTIWTARAYLAKNLLLEHCSRRPAAASQASDEPPGQDPSLAYALRMLECDTKLAASPLARGFLWHLYYHFPFPAYAFIVHYLKKRPAADEAERAWEAMGENYKARGMQDIKDYESFFILWSRLIMQAWEARKAVLGRSGAAELEIPWIVADIKRKISQMSSNSALRSDAEQLGRDHDAAATPAAGINVSSGLELVNASGNASDAQFSLAAPSPFRYGGFAEAGNLMDLDFMGQGWPTAMRWPASGDPAW